MNKNIKINNFDFLRLFAATQVVFGHAFSHLHLSDQHTAWIEELVGYFPGVPIFFVISGFLISASFERNSSLRYYFLNRFLRIYPALWVAFFIAVIGISCTGYWEHSSVTFFSFMQWTLAQLSLAQFYNPEFLRQFGVGVINGSLWTISVELQFYLVIPILYFFIKKMSFHKSNYLLGSLIGIFALASYVTNHQTSSIVHKFISVSLVPYFYIFLLGIFCQRNIFWLRKAIENKFLFYLLSYILFCLVFEKILRIGSNTPNFFAMILLLPVILSFAFSYTSLSQILHDNDISYGIYIYHMIFINFFVQYHDLGHRLTFLKVYLLTIFAATLSWFLIEKPALKLKRYAFRSLQTEQSEMQNPVLDSAIH